jgi:hypothetical protein
LKSNIEFFISENVSFSYWFCLLRSYIWDLSDVFIKWHFFSIWSISVVSLIVLCVCPVLRICWAYLEFCLFAFMACMCSIKCIVKCSSSLWEWYHAAFEVHLMLCHQKLMCLVKLYVPGHCWTFDSIHCSLSSMHCGSIFCRSKYNVQRWHSSHQPLMMETDRLQNVRY